MNIIKPSLYSLDSCNNDPNQSDKSYIEGLGGDGGNNGNGGDKPTDTSLIFTKFSNAELVNFGIEQGLLNPGNSAKDLAEIVQEYDEELGFFLMQIVNYNAKSKRGKSGKNFSLSGKVDGILYKNPKEYLGAIKEKLVGDLNKLIMPKDSEEIKTVEQLRIKISKLVYNLLTDTHQEPYKIRHCANIFNEKKKKKLIDKFRS